MRHAVGQTKNGFPVYVDLIHSRAASHIAGQPYLLTLAKEAVRRIAARGPQMEVEQDMGRPIGYDFVITTTDTSTILYAQLVREESYTRFVKNGKPLATPYLTVVLRRDAEENYELHDIWIGRSRPPRPDSPQKTPGSKAFWDNHAVILDTQQLQLKTVTKVCPY